MNLHISGKIKINATDEAMVRLSSLVAEFELPLLPSITDGEWTLRIKEDELDADLEEPFKHFLVRAGKELPGTLVGGVEVWWPFAIESGPQLWVISPEGHVFISESSVVWDEPKRFEA